MWDRIGIEAGGPVERESHRRNGRGLRPSSSTRGVRCQRAEQTQAVQEVHGEQDMGVGSMGQPEGGVGTLAGGHCLLAVTRNEDVAPTHLAEIAKAGF